MTVSFVLLDADGLEKQSLSSHVYVEALDLPMICTNASLADVECASAIQMAQHSAKEFHLVHQLAVDFHQPLFFWVHREGTLHLMEDLRLTRGGMVGGVGLKI